MRMRLGQRGDDFDYFVADVDVEPAEPKKKKAAPVVEEPEDEEDDESEDEDDDDEDDEDDEDLDDEDDEDDEDEDDDRYDWDLEDDNKKMVIIGVILALVIVAVVGFGVKTFLDKSKGNDASVTTEQEAEDDQEGDAELVIRGDGEAALMTAARLRISRQKRRILLRRKLRKKNSRLKKNLQSRRL